MMFKLSLTLIDTNEIQGDVNAVLEDTKADGHLETRLDAYIKEEVDDVQTVVDAVLEDTKKMVI